MRNWAAGLALLTSTAFAFAQDDACAVAAHLAYTDYGLPHVAAAVEKGQPLDVLVLGSGSSTLAGPGGADQAYPARLQQALHKLIPEAPVKLLSQAKGGRTTADMARDIQKLVKTAKPTLVIWQTGTVDAMRGIDQDVFQDALETGVDALKKVGTDVILMNMQYSPRTESMIALSGYSDIMRAVAQQREIPLFDRFAIMKHWNELGTFDLLVATKSIDMAVRVHQCIARLLADVIVEGVKMSAMPAKEGQ
jgi:lysophospholipase L1-like esterase